MKREALEVRRHGMSLESDVSRVIMKPFSPVGPSSPGYVSRMRRLVLRGAKLSDADARRILDDVRREFAGRHRDIETKFQEGFERAKEFLPPGVALSSSQRLLIGSYLVCEYSLEAAALFNPSIVPHPDQHGVLAGGLRFIMSLRATGEGHISSIEFRTGIINAKGEVTLDPAGKFVSTPTINPDPVFTASDFFIKLELEDRRNSSMKEIVRSLRPRFSRSELVSFLERRRRKGGKLSAGAKRALGSLESLLELNYEISFPDAVPLSERAIFPVSSFEANGIEDARFVRFTEAIGDAVYYATYTAYDGKIIMPLLLETADFVRFRIHSLSGEAARNKGMALFPRKVNGRYAAVSRHDAENLYLAYSDNISEWNSPMPLLQPSAFWEFTQIGNCGSPIETDKGWILLTHGVGPVRKYCIGAILLDRDNPERVIGRLDEPLIAPDASEREGYVPNVVYTCGAIAHNGRLIIPYAMSDRATRMASVSIPELL
ncbi:MAG TPA: glycoside hydrolase family 130 protein, partial [Bacteroidota bacterium]|nr:glycoside hydrolase family 130 protein [Bacteroidota bacterium]